MTNNFFATLIFLLFLYQPNYVQGQNSEDQVLRIGIIAPISGDHHAESHLQGAKAKFEEMKDEVSKSTGFRIELLVRDSTSKDSEGEKKKALRHARELVEKHGVIVILGAVNSHATIPIQKYIESLTTHNSILITSSSTNTSITDKKNDWTFRNNLSNSKLTIGLAKYIYEEKGISSLAIFYFDNVWGKGAFQDFKNAFKGNIVYSEAISKNTTNFENQIAQIADKKAQGLCIFAGDISKGSILEAKKENSATQFLPVFTIGLPHRLIELGEEYLHNLTAVSSFYDDPNKSSIKYAKEILWKHFRTLPKPELNFNSARAMESMEILLKAIRKVKSNDTTAIRDEIRKMQYEGLNYQIRFDQQTGDLIYSKPFFLNHYGKWLDLSNWHVFVRPIILFFVFFLLFIISYLISSRKFGFSRPQSLLIASLLTTTLLYIGDSKHWISVGETLSKISNLSTSFSSLITIISLALSVYGFWKKPSP